MGVGVPEAGQNREDSSWRSRESVRNLRQNAFFGKNPVVKLANGSILYFTFQIKCTHLPKKMHVNEIYHNSPLCCYFLEKTSCKTIDDAKKLIQQMVGPQERLQSWESCYFFFQTHYKEIAELKKSPLNDDSPNTAADLNTGTLPCPLLYLAELELGFYLASFGMFRPSGQLLNCGRKKYREFLVDICSAAADIPAIQPFSKLIKDPEQYSDAVERMSHAVEKAWKKMFGEKSEATTTLVTKVLMGMFGLTPADDTNVKNAINDFKKEKSKAYPQIENLHHNPLPRKHSALWHAFVLDNKDFLEKVSPNVILINSKAEFSYPLMRTLDIVLWLTQEK